MNSGLPLGRLFGTEIRAHWTWIFVLAVVTVFFGAGLSAQTEAGFDAAWGWASAVACAVLVFGSVTAHELAHVWVARRYGIGSEVAVVQLLGGTYLMETRPRTPGQEFRASLAGPLVSLAVMLAFAALVVVTQVGWGALDAGTTTASSIPAGVLAVSFIGQVLGLFNLFLAVVNLIPAYPMDGARIVHAVAWARSGRDDQAMAVSSRVGRYVGYVIIFIGVLLMPVVGVLPGLTLVVAGWLILGSSRVLDRRAMLQNLIAGVRVLDAADPDPARIPPQLTLDVFAGDYLGERMGGAALVERGDELLGLIGTSQIRRIPRRNWTAMRTEQAMVPVGRVPRASGDSDLWRALEVLERSGLDGLLVGTGGQVPALLTRRSAARLIRERAEERAWQMNPGRVGLRFPGRRPPGPPMATPRPDVTPGEPNDRSKEEPDDKPNNRPKDE